MTTATDHKGIYVQAAEGDNPACILIQFNYQQQAFEEVLKLEPTKANLKYANSLRNDVLSKIKRGLFDPKQYFAKSPSAIQQAPPSNSITITLPLNDNILTFAKYAAIWWEGQHHLSQSTRKSYKTALYYHWIPKLGRYPLKEIKFSLLKSAIESTEWSSAKTRNNNLSPLRLLFESALLDGEIDTNPMQAIKNQRVGAPQPNPFTGEEVKRILAHMKKHYPAPVLNYFQFAFFSGLRTEELIALRWSDWDQGKQTITIDKARVLNNEKGTKTGRVRVVHLHPPAVQALNDQYQHKLVHDDHIFFNPKIYKPWASDKAQRIRYWQPTLEALGIPKRRAYETRHTYATFLLTSGCNHAYAADQMGHSVAIFQRVYTRWIRGNGEDKEREKVGQFIAGIS